MKINKKKIKSLCLFLLLLCVLFHNYTVNINIIENNNYENRDINQKIKNAWTLSPFIIDDYGNGDYTWSEAVSQPWCSGAGTSNNPYIIDDIYINAAQYRCCLEIRNSNKYFIIKDSVFANAGIINGDAAVKFRNVDNGKMIESRCIANEKPGYPGRSYAMILLYSNDNTIDDNDIYNNQHGILIDDYSNNNKISNNNIFDHSGTAITIEDGCDYNEVSHNTIDDNSWAMILDSDHNTISRNEVTRTEFLSGIHLDGSNYNYILGNTIKYSKYNGLTLSSSSNNNTVADNLISSNAQSGQGGVGVSSSDNNTFINNTISTNYDDGFYLFRSDNNKVYNNTIKNNFGYQIYINQAQDNLFVKNNFIGSSPVLDNGINQQWNNSDIGNYWSDYTNLDEDDDGIGDAPYIISGTSGSQDYFPIWDDGIDSPIININLPDSFHVYGKNPPFYDILISSPNLNTTWYLLNNITLETINTTISGLSGTIDQNIWNSVGNGTITLKFCANDSNGDLNIEEVQIRKDIKDPEIIIEKPIENDLYGSFPPEYNISVNEPNLDTVWYMLENGTIKTENRTISSLNGTIDQDLWDLIGNGTITLSYYANDTLGNLGFQEIHIRKDLVIPIIKVIDPKDNKFFKFNAPQFNISFSGRKNTTWYILNNGVKKYIFNETSGQINQSVWENENDGKINITFFLNNSVGQIDSVNITVIKDATNPMITIYDPINNSFYGINSPTYNISIIEQNLHSIWYMLDDQIIKTENKTIMDLTGG